MNNTLLALTTTAALVLSTNVMADHQRHERHHHKHATYARVVHVDPIYKTVRVAYPEKHCWHKEAQKPVRHRVNYVPPEKLLLGGVIGGVVGHELGRNHNQELSTVAGAVIGTTIAYNANADYYGRGDDRGDYRRHQHQRKHCKVKNRYRTEQRLKGYRVTYRYKGELYTTWMREHPGKRIPVNVEVTPERRHRHDR